jgi:hypothetical protein
VGLTLDETPEQWPGDEDVYYCVVAGLNPVALAQRWFVATQNVIDAAGRHSTANVSLCDCSYHDVHAVLHRWHPRTGRIHCTTCHPVFSPAKMRGLPQDDR